MRKYYVYILTNEFNSVLYTGVTNSLSRRYFEHVNKFRKNTFTAKYSLDKLVYFEEFLYIDQAIHREKQIKSGSRKKKNEIIRILNPEWKNLFGVVSI